MPKDYPGAFAALRAILAKHGRGMTVHADTPAEFTLITEAVAPNGKPLWFGCVTSKKSAVTYHLIPLYYNPKLLATLSPALEAKRSGKTCFHFQYPEKELFAGLDELTRLGREQWQRAGFLEPGPLGAERLAAAVRSGGGDPEALAARRRQVLAARRTSAARRPAPNPASRRATSASASRRRSPSSKP